jgi:DNA-directed RNA polymerase specialized sigma24 family protein
MTTNRRPMQHPTPMAEAIDAAPPSDVRLTSSPSAPEIRAVVGDEAIQAHIRKVVWRRAGRKAPGDLVDELVQQANLAMLSAKSGPRSDATAQGWASKIAVRVVVDHFRREEAQAKWLDRDAEIEELAATPDDTSGPFVPAWLLTEWLAPLVANDPHHQQTYELLRHKASTQKTLAQVAADHGITEGALKSRVHALKAKYEPRWKRRQRMFLLLLLLYCAVGLALVWLFWPGDADSNGSFHPSTTPHLDGLVHGPYVSHPPPASSGAP